MSWRPVISPSLREMPDTQINDGNLETAIANMSAFIEKLADIEPSRPTISILAFGT